MRKYEFKKILKENKNNLQKLIYKHINGDLFFTSRQISIIINKRGIRWIKK